MDGYLGEYILLSEDKIGGALVLGTSHRIKNDNFDYFHLYKLLTNDDGTKKFYQWTMNALPTIITPAKGSMQELVQSR